MTLNRVLSNWGEMIGYHKAPSTRIWILFFEIGDFFPSVLALRSPVIHAKDF